MSGIAGIAGLGKQAEVEGMLDKITHRGPGGRKVMEIEGATLGIVWSTSQTNARAALERDGIVHDGHGEGHLALAKAAGGKLMLMRDQLGVAPLYGTDDSGSLIFASEVKALQEATILINELPAGHRYNGRRLELYFELKKQQPLDDSSENIAGELHRRLAAAVEKCSNGDVMGSWLSGGLDSSTLAALARPHLRVLHTFAAGLAGAPDLEFAREVASFIQSQHHEVVLTLDSMLEVLPKVIYHLESFDALLVRSTITNYSVAKLASEYVSEVFSGEGGDELFGGYEYLKSLEPAMLPGELIDITNRLHNTALQRVDRSASAHGTVAHTAFLDPDVVDYAQRIPADYKIHNGVEKWILRRAIEGKLPDRVLNRTKAKFWEGAGVKEHLAQYAEEHITSDDFNRERKLKNGWLLDSKEELMYYRIFKEYFGTLEDLSWMGRTKKLSSPTSSSNA
jgi:asparagine synthase (glutamine-hydrolysing)